MAVIKAVSSKAGIGQAIDYVTKKEKTDQKLVSGLHCVPETAKIEMQTTKKVWGKTKGRTYKHFVQSFAPEEEITPEQAHQIACEFAESLEQWKGFEVLIATHKDREHVHTHFIVNSVSYMDGHKLQQSRSDLKNMKACSDDICQKQGLHITEKGKTFSGELREETTAYRKEIYQFLKQAEQGEAKSYVQNIALAIMDCRENAVSREEFVEQMKARGYGGDWRDSRKYITFIDLRRQEQGEKQCKIRNNKLEKYYNIDFGKEALENEFENNSRSKQTAEYKREQAREQIRSGANRTAEPEDNRAGGTAAERDRSSRPIRKEAGNRKPDDTDAFIRQIEAEEQNSRASRAYREASRQRSGAKGKRETEGRDSERKRSGRSL
ncbi:MAG: relaxase/mobilization nuclease domain-containing protein [Lachnospiraceae bacterium]|nr:relaxase/mobilization nuclease domain-containing protein [Lachnospiraceae bacterium]